MREILFKAKRIDNGEWVEGDLLHSVYKIYDTCVGKYGCEVGIHQVDESTICQYTGLTDKNGKKIWENDVIGFIDCSQYDNGYSEHYCIGEVYWDEETVSFQVTERISCESYEALDGDCSVLGNIFDNPELMKGEERENLS